MPQYFSNGPLVRDGQDVNAVTIFLREQFVTGMGDHWKATSTFQVPYVMWGIKDPSVFLLKVKPVADVESELSGSEGSCILSRLNSDRRSFDPRFCGKTAVVPALR